MRKMIILTLVLMMMLGIVGVAWDMATLQEAVIRLHVVGASDSEEDQNVKLLVKDAVNAYLAEALSDVHNTEEAKQALQSRLPDLKSLAEQVLRKQGFSQTVTVSLEKESFPRRDYDTFSLPSGVYTALRIRIGEAAGRNWWCVVFPSLCLPAAGKDFQTTAVGAGFTESLADTLTVQKDYELRFFLMDLFGQLQNFFHECE